MRRARRVEAVDVQVGDRRAQAFLELAEATGDRLWWDLATGLIKTVRSDFVEERDGVVVSKR